RASEANLDVIRKVMDLIDKPADRGAKPKGADNAPEQQFSYSLDQSGHILTGTDTNTGKVVWRLDLGSAFRGSLEAESDQVILVDVTGRRTLVDGRTGKILRVVTESNGAKPK